MRHGWLAISLLLGLFLAPTMHTSISHAGPPQIGQSSSSWWPSMSSWKMPSMPWSSSSSSSSSSASSTPARPTAPKASTYSEPSFVRSTRLGLSRAWTGTKKATSSAWESTKNVLRPYDPPPSRTSPAGRTYRAPESGGFWANLFRSSEPEPKMSTVNDFLKQPTPY